MRTWPLFPDSRQRTMAHSPFGKRRYNAWNEQVKERRGGRVQKVSVIAGFSCPNRDGTLAWGGCTFCNNDGFTPGYLERSQSITAQIDAGLEFLHRRYPTTTRFIAYFQSYSNTYGELQRLRACYQEALAHPQICGLALGTRPDCLSDAVLDYLAELAREHIVELEIGIESCNDAVLAHVNRGHDFAASVDATRRAAARGLEVTAHVMLGLPGESRQSMLDGAGKLSALPIHALKIHQLQLVRGTALARQWQHDPASVPLLGEQACIELLADYIERLSSAIVLQRVGSEVPPSLKMAPEWNLRLSELAPRLSEELARRGSWQGARFTPAPLPTRRAVLGAALSLPLWPLPASAQNSTKPSPQDSTRLHFPRDFGSHPDFAIEWWYLTGYASSKGRSFGFQITFFRSRVAATQAMTSAFAAKQLFFAHAAVTDVSGKQFFHDQRVARASGSARLDRAAASQTDTELRLDNWRLRRTPANPAQSGSVERYLAQLPAADFALDLQFTPTQPVLLQGEQGWSRKGPQAAQASYYYSQPQLVVAGRITLRGTLFELDAETRASAWLDHEWSQSLLDSQTVGWDWIGINLFDGSALTAFQLRTPSGQPQWAGGSFRVGTAAATALIFGSDDLKFEPVRFWRSPLTQARYPVEWLLHIKHPDPIAAAAGLYRIRAVLDAQELDSRRSVGAVYWEGLTELFDAAGKLIGRGYLEMTGYAAALRL